MFWFGGELNTYIYIINTIYMYVTNKFNTIFHRNQTRDSY